MPGNRAPQSFDRLPENVAADLRVGERAAAHADDLPVPVLIAPFARPFKRQVFFNRVAVMTFLLQISGHRSSLNLPQGIPRNAARNIVHSNTIQGGR